MEASPGTDDLQHILRVLVLEHIDNWRARSLHAQSVAVGTVLGSDSSSSAFVSVVPSSAGPSASGMRSPGTEDSTHGRGLSVAGAGLSTPSSPRAVVPGSGEGEVRGVGLGVLPPALPTAVVVEVPHVASVEEPKVDYVWSGDNK